MRVNPEGRTEVSRHDNYILSYRDVLRTHSSKNLDPSSFTYVVLDVVVP
jgi:hypothetical protein